MAEMIIKFESEIQRKAMMSYEKAVNHEDKEMDIDIGRAVFVCSTED